MPKYRDIGPFLQRVRAFLLGREHKTTHRYQNCMAPRPGPKPDIPDEMSTKRFSNYYYMRDARCKVKPPIDVLEEIKQLEAKAAEAAKTAKPAAAGAAADAADPTPPKAETTKKDPNKLPTPGKQHDWD